MVYVDSVTVAHCYRNRALFFFFFESAFVCHNDYPIQTEDMVGEPINTIKHIVRRTDEW